MRTGAGRQAGIQSGSLLLRGFLRVVFRPEPGMAAAAVKLQSRSLPAQGGRERLAASAPFAGPAANRGPAAFRGKDAAPDRTSAKTARHRRVSRDRLNLSVHGLGQQNQTSPASDSSRKV